jgi:hypothetical protein
MLRKVLAIALLVEFIVCVSVRAGDDGSDELQDSEDGLELEQRQSRQRRKTSCPQDFVLLQSFSGSNGCFKFGLEGRTWQEWSQLCRSYHPNARLASLDDKGKSDAVRHYLLTIPDSDLRQCGKQAYSMPNGFFTAGQRQVNNNCQSQFYWKQGQGYRDTPVTFYDWAPDEPNCHGERGYTRESCIVLWEHDQYRWNDLACERKICAVCEIP